MLADGIEDLQVAYACDNIPRRRRAARRLPTKLTDEWILNVAANPIPACNRPDAVRITLIARSLTADTLLSGVTSNKKPAIEDGAAGAVDSFRHRVVTTTVFPRN